MIIRNYLFHRVSPARDNLWDPLDPRLFERIIRYLMKNYRVCKLEAAYLDKRKNNNKPLACVVFDDGYKDNIEYAAPILKKYDCPASFYIATDCITKNIPTWTYIVDYLFQHTSKLSLSINNGILPGELKGTEWAGKDERLKYCRSLKPFLKKITHKERKKICDKIIEGFNDVQMPRDMMLSWDNLRELKRAGFAIGSHAKTHAPLASIEDREQLRQELKESYDIIAKELNECPITISYPVGSYNDLVIDEAKSCGYRLGLITGQRFYNSLKDNLYAIPRVEIYNENWLKARMRITGSLEAIKKFIPR